MKTCSWLIALALAPAFLHAQQADTLSSGRISTTAHMVGVGGTRVLDTYLSQEHFKGMGATFLATIERSKPGRRWTTAMQHQANISRVSDRRDMVRQIEGSYNFYWGKHYGWTMLSHKLTLQAGAMADANIGFIYNTYNGNNPVQARLHINIMPSAVATYRFALWGRRMALRYEIEVPLMGIMFSPNYGQTYYEIFSQGNYDHNIVPTTMVSAPCFRQQAMVDVNISRRTTLRVGYLGDYQQASVNNLKSHVYTHRFMIGIVKRFTTISFRP